MRESLDEPERSAAHRRLQLLRAQPGARRCAARLLAALDKEQGEFVRPALVARAARRYGDDAARAARRCCARSARGEDFFRSAVIEALGDYKAAYAFDALTAVAKLDGPLQDDAALALGKIGDKRALETLAGAAAHRAARGAAGDRGGDLPARRQLRVAPEAISIETLKFADKNAGFQELLRGAAAGLGALGVAGHARSASTRCSRSASRRAIRRARRSRWRSATVALRNTPLMLTMLEKRAGSRRRRSRCSPKASTCSKRISTRSGSSRPCAAATGTRRTDRRRATLMQTLIGKLDF